MDLKVGNTVRYVGKPDQEVEWGYHQFDDPNERLLAAAPWGVFSHCPPTGPPGEKSHHSHFLNGSD